MKRLPLLLPLVPSVARADPGDHSRLAPDVALAHVLGSADHLLVLAGALCGAALAFGPVRRAFARALRSPR